MQKLSLKVLLRFLSVYSHWNLVRRSEGYHLYFITKDSESSVMQFPERRRGVGRHLSGQQRSSRRRKRKPHVPTMVRRTKMKSKSVTSEGVSSMEPTASKDVFIFSPIFETVEEAVQVGVEPVENSLKDQQKRTTSFRSSVDSLAWDDFLSYKAENSCSEDDSYSTLENSTVFDSKESTPFLAEDMPSDFGLKEIKTKDPYNKCVRYEADKLLKDMLQLRKEIEEMNYQTNLHPESVENKNVDSTVTQDESCLMDRLETMTAEVKKEMDEEQLKKKQQQLSSPSKRMNIDDDTKIRNFFKSIVDKKGSGEITPTAVATSPSVTSPTDSTREATTPTNSSSDKESTPKLKAINDDIPKKTLTMGKSSATAKRDRRKSKTPQTQAQPRGQTPAFSDVKQQPTQMPPMKLDLKETTAITAVPPVNSAAVKEPSSLLSVPPSPSPKKRAKKKTEKAVRPSFSTDSLKRKSKKKKDEGNVDVPFCAYNSYTTSSKAAQQFFNSLDRRKKKKELQTVLTAEEKIRAKEMLTSLLAIREKKGNKDNKVIESLISVISLSSTNLSLPSAPTSNTVKFKELFDFEANFSESREVFQKLAMGGSGEQHTLQDLFPWSDKEGGNLNKLKSQYSNQ